MRMRRVVVLSSFGPPEVMSWGEEPCPERGVGEVLVEVEAIGVNFADTMVRRGEYRRDQPLSFIPGSEVAGVVLEGPADGPPPGTRVIVFMEDGGGYADHVVAPLDHVFPVLDGLAASQAAAVFSQGVTAWYAVHRFGRIAAGMTVLIHAAAGGLGSLCVQLCAALGAEVIGVASTDDKRERARAHGASHVIAPDPEALAAEVRELTGGRGVDVVIDGVGGPVFAPSLRALAFNGH
ncbi:MAG: zinc-binding dehydrogenase, partial [Actinobacteria bacterium]|nr:zinc-binding dehydrogenase [Actinomycetota bacterium]